MIDLVAYHAWRVKVAPWHPAPGGRDSLDYLVTEVGEAVDARLRKDRPGDDRTNGKRRHLARELAQVIDMALCAGMQYGFDLDAELRAWMSEVEARKP